MSGSRENSLFYQLGKLTAEAEGNQSGPSGSGRVDYRTDEHGFGGGDEPTRRWGRLLLYGAGLLFVTGLVGIVDFALPTLVALTLLLVGIAAVLDSVEIVQAYENRALTVFGADEGLLGPGLHFIPPFVSKTYQFDMRTETLDVPRQEAITRDNSPVTADAVVYIRVMDATRAFLGVDDYRRATSMLAQTSLRAAIGDMELDETLSKREQINDRIRRELDEPTDAWGVRVEAVEVREVLPSRGVVNAMEQQSSAERYRRAMILEAQGERRAAVESAEGARAANVLRAQGEKQASILEAQGDSVATVLRARAAEAMGERAIILRGMETLERIGESESTTFVVPQELTSLVGRYGQHLSGSDVREEREGLESRSFDTETRELLGLDDIEGLLDELSAEARAVDDRERGEAVSVDIEDVGESVEPEQEPEPESE